MPSEETGLDNSSSPAGSKSTRADSKETGSKTGNATFQVQSEFINALQEMSRDWMACATAEIDLGLKLSKKLTAARSVPDAIAAYQEWLSNEVGARAEDVRRLMSNGQKFMDTGARFLSNGWSSAGMTT
jgi:hypothetical protein